MVVYLKYFCFLCFYSLFLVLLSTYLHRFGIQYFHPLVSRIFFPWTSSVDFCLSVGESESRVLPAPKFLCGPLWAMCPVDHSTSWSLQATAVFTSVVREAIESHKSVLPASGRHPCLYVWGWVVSPRTAVILHSTDYNWSQRASCLIPCIQHSLLGLCSFTLTQKGFLPTW